MPKQKAPCGTEVEADTAFDLGREYSQHQAGCSECQAELERLRKEWYGE